MIACARPLVAGARSAEGWTWSPRRSQVVVCTVAALVALAAEWVAFGWHDPLHWLPDLLTGAALVAAGAVASAWEPESRTGRLLSVTGVAWFAGNFGSVGWAPAAWLATQAAYLHRGLIIDAIVSFSTAGVRSRAARAAVAAGYVASLAPLAKSDAVTMIVGAALLAGGLAQLRRARRGPRPSAGPAIAAAVLLGGAMLIGAAARLSLPLSEGDEAVLLAYQAALCLAALELAAGIARRAGEHAQLGDLVVELGESRSGSLRDGLANALGDPTLEVGYWLADGRFVDAAGRVLVRPTARSGRAVTPIERAGQPVAAIMHDAAVLDDPRLVSAVSSAARLAASNAQLHSEVGAQLSELRESRRRLLDAGDEERRRLERRLQEGVEWQLEELSCALGRVRAHAARGSPAPAVVEQIGVAQEQLERSLAELVELARGLHPRVLAESGLAGALAQLAASSPVDVEVTAVDVPVAVAVAGEVAAYFVCAEALANVAKYAFASRVWIDVRCGGADLTVRVRDDGVGGADPRRGSGLRGLVDRVEAHGGRLRIESPPRRGTLLVATIPSKPSGVR